MTNGEMMQKIFPDMEIEIGEIDAYVWINHEPSHFDKTWWNSEYKEPNYSEIPTGSTTKNNLAHNLCNSCTNIGCEFQSGIVRTECAFYMPPHIEPDNCGNYVVQNSTTKNCRTCRNFGSRHGICEICKDNKCWTEKEPTTKNNLEVAAVSRQAVLDLIADYDLSMGQVVRGIHALPSVTPQEPQSFKWCTDCKEYDQEKHCCHRYSKVIRNTVAELRQEPVLDKIRAEIEQTTSRYSISRERGGMGQVEWSDNLIKESEVLEIIDKYKAESEDK